MARPRGPARPVRLHGYGDLDLPRLRRPAHPRVRARARPAAGRPRPVAGRGRHLPARAPVRVRPGRLPPARRPDPLPGRARDAVQPLQGRGHHRRPRTRAMRPRSRPRLARWPRPATSGRDRAPRRRTRRARPSWPRAYARYQELLAANGCIDFGDQVALALRLVRDSAAARAADRRTLPIHPRGRVPGHEPGPGGARHAAGGAPPQRDGRGRRRPGDLRLPRRGRSTTSSTSRPATRGPGPCVLRRNYRSLAPILDAAYRLVRFNDPDRLEVRTGLVKRLRAQRREPSAAPVRLEAFATGSEEADWIAADIARRIAAGAHAARSRHPGPGQRPRRPDPAGAELGRHPVAVLGCVGPVCAAGGPAAHGVPADRRGPRVERGRVRAGAVRGVRPRRRGPERHRQHGPAAEPVGAGHARGARPPARHPARRTRHPQGGPSPRRRHRPLRGAGPRPAGGRGPVRVPARQRHPGPAGRDRHDGRGGGARQRRPVLRRHPLRRRPCSRTTGPCSWRGTCRR